MTKYLTIICYDIVENRVRNAVSEVLVTLGSRRNYSVFECMLTDTERFRLRVQIEGMVDKNTDRVLFYVVCRKCYLKYESIGTESGDYDACISV